MPTRTHSDKKTHTRRPGKGAHAATATALRQELLATIAQVCPLALSALLPPLDRLTKDSPRNTPGSIRKQFLASARDILMSSSNCDKPFELYPTLTNADAQADLVTAALADLEAAFERIDLRESLTGSEKLEILHGMLRTRHLDARLKKFFVSSEIKTPAGAFFQGKGFRSMGQEAIYAAAIRLKRTGPTLPLPATVDHNGKHGNYAGDFVGIMIRDLGLALAMGVAPYDVMAAQMGKASKPTFGKDLHIGDFDCGVLPPSAPLGLSTGNAIGLALALEGSGRVVINCTGEGATSSGEWHEAINFAAVRKSPIVFIVENNQTALSTPTCEQFACTSLARKGIGYGIPSITVDGTDPEAVFSAVTQAADACRRGAGPSLVELVSFRMCGHAHHDDMLYFGAEPEQFLTYPSVNKNGYIDRDKYEFWREKDPIEVYRRQLLSEGVLSEKQYEKLVGEVVAEMESAAAQVVAAPWPDAAVNGPAVTDGEHPEHSEPLAGRTRAFPLIRVWNTTEDFGFAPEPGGDTFWQAIVEALSEEMQRDENVFVLGEDVGGNYGNAFVILKPLLETFADRLINTPLAESAIIGAATGAALLGKRPVAEIQFNDFVANGFNQLVNNTAKIYARWHQPVPVTIRLPWGGLRHAGPYHSQNTEPWFYRVPGLKIVCPATPREAKGLLKSAIRDDNPVLFYEHIALYRDASIKQTLPDAVADFTIPFGKAHIKRDGSDLTIITYGAYVHRCLAAAGELASRHHVSARVLDLRSLQPLDKEAILWSVKRTNRVLIVQEDSKTGGIGQSIAAIISEEAFEYLDAPVRVLGALDTPVPYSPPLEKTFLISTEQIIETAKLLTQY